jgi:hypothetical protein
MTDEVFARGDRLSVPAVTTPVMSLNDVLTTKLHALDEHSLDYTRLLGIARSLREQIDWQQLRVRTCQSPYAKAFLALVEELGIAQEPAGIHHAGRSRRVRVISSDSR